MVFLAPAMVAWTKPRTLQQQQQYERSIDGELSFHPPPAHSPLVCDSHPVCSAASEYGRREASSASPSTRVQAPAASSGAICIPTMSAEVRARSNRAPRGLTQHARTVLSGGSANGRWWPSGRAQSRLTPTPKLCCPPATCSASYRTLSASRQHSGLRVQTRQWRVDRLALLLQLSLVSRGALGCATRACTQLCDSRHADLLNALLPPSACVSMRTGDEDAAVQAILWCAPAPASAPAPAPAPAPQPQSQPKPQPQPQPQSQPQPQLSPQSQPFPQPKPWP